MCDVDSYKVNVAKIFTVKYLGEKFIEFLGNIFEILL